MKSLVLLLSTLICMPAWSLDIVEALNRGQRVQADTCVLVDAGQPEAQVIAASFERVKRAAGVTQDVTVRLAECPGQLVQVLGGEILVHPVLASWGEGERLFALAHELGHIINGDWGRFTAEFAAQVGPDMDEAQVNLVLRRMAPRVRELMHGFEYGADEYALGVLDAMGRDSLADGTACINRVPAPPGSPTHPGSSQRIAKLSLGHTHAH